MTEHTPSIKRLDRALGTTSDERISNLVSLILAATIPMLFALARYSGAGP